MEDSTSPNQRQDKKHVWKQVKSGNVAWKKGNIKDRFSSKKIISSLDSFFFFSFLSGCLDLWERSRLWAVNFFQQCKNSGADRRAINKELDKCQGPSPSLDQAEIFPWIAFFPTVRDLCTSIGLLSANYPGFMNIKCFANGAEMREEQCWDEGVDSSSRTSFSV